MLQLKKIVVVFFIISLVSFSVDASSKFQAIGPTEKIKQKPRLKEAVKVTFDLLPTEMHFDLPCYVHSVTENGIKYINGWTETYDPKIEDGGMTCEILNDKNNVYTRMWIESQNDARIIVRWHSALSNNEDKIAHTYIHSNSPYGDGDWVDEWYTIYPDGTHIRHAKIYTGLTDWSWPVTDGDAREIIPNVVHEFHEMLIYGRPNKDPIDDIEVNALTLLNMEGEYKDFSFKPYPKNFDTFRYANMMILNLKSKYRPFTIAIPHGAEIEPYEPEDNLPLIFQCWGSKKRGYATSLGHILNWRFYRQTNYTLEHVYFSGMIKSDEKPEKVISLADSWINAPQFIMEDFEPTYKNPVYDHRQKAYVLECKNNKPQTFEFQLGPWYEGGDQFEYYDEDKDAKKVTIINPAFVLKGWGKKGVELKIDGKPIKPGKDFRIGYENKDNQTNLVFWLNFKANKTTNFVITPTK